MNSPSGDLRRAAVTALVAAQTVLKDEQKIYAVVDGLGKDQVSTSSASILLHELMRSTADEPPCVLLQ